MIRGSARECLSLGKFHKHLRCRLDDGHFVEDGGSVICDDDLPVGLAHLCMQSSHDARDIHARIC